ncbi:TPA: hypothetical protein HA291_02145, partial [Candidatus Micrarchaeota archaeon]|nr:hypothetical protein [Candidatus Micrarchaeota archaeon]HII09606.1 hypothetical protein [Candidatus Micrarchaeota archaeon]
MVKRSSLLLAAVLFTLILTSSIASNIVGTLTGFNGPYGVSASPNGFYVYVANNNNNTVSIANVVNGGTNSITFGTLIGNVMGQNAIFTQNVVADNGIFNVITANFLLGLSSLYATTFNGNFIGNNAIFTGNVAAANFFGNIIGSNTIAFSTATGTTLTSNIVGNNAVFVTLYGNVI